MKILRVIGSADPATGGPIEGLVQVSNLMAGMGCSNEMLCLDAPGDPWLADFPLPIHAVGPGLGKYRYTPKLHRWLRARAKEYDAVIIHGLWNYSSVGTWRGLAHSSTPYAVFTHGMLDPWFRRAYPAKHIAKQLFWLPFEGRVLADAQAVLFTTAQERDLARGEFFGHRYRERVIAYGTADAPDRAERQIAQFRAILPALEQRPYVLFLSRIHRKKGCDILIDGFAAIAAKYPMVDLVIAGPDQTGWRQDLEHRATALGISGRVHWPGMLTGEAKWGAFRAAQAFVLPSHQENFGIAVTEALSCSTPVLISDKVNICREVETDSCGFVAEDTKEGVTMLLDRFLLLDASGRERMRKSARQTFLTRFHAHSAARDLIRLVEEMRTTRKSDYRAVAP